ncbi:hypothetical protein [Dichotomicrobium thermohalophilum]|uniref:Uncharacterized protein n=1 Tax=Dichotomicrobium thermohalophilum TaxID=933063 RepID=A0A397Q3Q5_9HYPH|nr:hypothetical protein [Dichotomicrobium thermohalophilum]RIA55039.1 hypothetical protein BXY53_0091 [Dichotomicrobium thermohalophilum]
MFESAKLKVERADHHIAELESAFMRFVERNPYTLSFGKNHATGSPAVRIRFGKELPETFALIIGDSIHNLRTALDHMTWELIGRDGGAQNRNLKFPTGSDRRSFEAACKGIKTPSQNVIAVLKATEAFPTGHGEPLYSLSRLDNADKHFALTPVISAAKLSNFTISSPDGLLKTKWENCTFKRGSGALLDIRGLRQGERVELDQDTQATPDIFFGKVEGAVDGEPVFPTLRQLRHATADTIDIVSRAIT